LRKKKEKTGMKTSHQCEAVLVTRAEGLRASQGDRCLALAESVHDGHGVCWVHKHAAANAERTEPVRFVEGEP
jgi:hypothetical protein